MIIESLRRKRNFSMYCLKWQRSLILIFLLCAVGLIQSRQIGTGLDFVDTDKVRLSLTVISTTTNVKRSLLLLTTGLQW